MKTKPACIFLFLVISIIACTFTPSLLTNISRETIPANHSQITPENSIQPEDTNSPNIVSEAAIDRIMPDDLEYLGAFRLPDTSGTSNWEYSGQGLTCYPSGDPSGPNDGFPGSLFGFGHDQQMLVSEISVPVPVISKNLEDLNTAETLQPFADITGGNLNIGEQQLPVADLEYLPSQTGNEKGKLHFAFGQHFQSFEPSHGWSNLDLSDPQTAGLWLFDSYTNYVVGDILFAVPDDWAQSNVSGQRMASSRFREGVWGGFGPTLFTYDPGDEKTPLPTGSSIKNITPLLLYGVQELGLTDIVTDESHRMKAYKLADHWTGGAWLTGGGKSAVVFIGTKAIGNSWYGFANGVLWDYACADQTPPTCPEVPDFPYENRGYWAEDYEAQIIFYDPADLAQVAAGGMQTWDPQPYATLALDPNLFNPEINLAESKRDLVMSAAFDRQHNLLFIVERLADGYKSVIHVWKVKTG
jgi:hypothetical protein